MNGALLIDAGNTRVKWGWRFGDELKATGEWLHAGLKNGDPPADFLNMPAGSSGRPQRIFAVNVAGDAMAARIRSCTTTLHGLEPELVSASREAHGVTNAYSDPESMGADRWVGMIGAFNLFGGPVCVVDAGTAVTIDVVDAAGAHLGGVIAPGMSMMRASLGAGTSDIPSVGDSAAEAHELLAGDTAAAVRSGARYSVSSLVDRVVYETTTRLGTDPRLIITGGDGHEVMHAAQVFGEYVPHLVLLGLGVFAGRQ